MSERDPPREKAAEWVDQFGAPPCNCLPHVGPYHGAECPRGKWWRNEGLLLQCGLLGDGLVSIHNEVCK
jgi:hypothetical protein